MVDVDERSRSAILCGFRSAMHEFLDGRLFGRGQITQITLDRVGDDVPLRGAPQFAECRYARLDVRRNPHAQLRIVLYFLPGASPGSGTADATNRWGGTATHE